MAFTAILFDLGLGRGLANVRRPAARFFFARQASMAVVHVIRVAPIVSDWRNGVRERAYPITFAFFIALHLALHLALVAVGTARGGAAGGSASLRRPDHFRPAARTAAPWLYFTMARISRDRDDVHIALLRGVNVGGSKKVPMLQLRDLARSLGFGNPRTLLNSGNLVYAAHGTSTEEAALALEQGILQRMKVSTPVLVITAAQLDHIIADNTIDDEDVDPSRLFVSIWRETYDRDALMPLLQQEWGEETLHIGSRAAYQHAPEGASESALVHAVAALLGDRVTARNWNTIGKLQDLVDDVATAANEDA